MIFVSKKTLVLFLFVLISSFSFSQKSGVNGVISSDGGGVLSFATIFVKQVGSGTTANLEGFYEIHLNPGRYDLVFQHLGMGTVVRTVYVDSASFVTLNVQLKPEDIILKEVTVGGGDNEDPAYTIMRKAIAKADYHRNVVDQYTANVYIKGSAKLKDYPWLAKKTMQKEGIEKGRVYLSESLSQIKFTRPNKFEQKVISVRSDRKENANPGSYIFGSFYEPEFADVVSPLSPKAFSYYKFEYLGTFKDRDYEVSRIKVTPRSKGEDVIDGVIALVEDSWSLHGMNIHFSKVGIDINMKVTFAPIDDKVWLPVSHQLKVDDKVLGFEFEAQYLSSVSDYKVKLNPKLFVENMEVIDEKKEKAHAKEVEKKQAASKKQAKKNEDASKLQQRLAAGEEITRKELKSLIKDFEKEEKKEMKEPDVISDFTFKDDSILLKVDSTYWDKVRPIPLTHEEVKGYEKADSVSAVEVAQAKGDTVKQKKHKGFQVYDLIVGDDYRVGKHGNFKIYNIMGGFNTVEGWNLIYRLALGTVLQDTNKTRLRISPVFRYSFEREKLSGYVNVMVGNKNFRVDVDAGRYIEQYNSDRPIHHIINTFTTLFLEKNLMKIYEQDFVQVKMRKVFNPKWTITSSWQYANRSGLENNTNFKVVDRGKIEGYTSNEPYNLTTSTRFPHHQALIGQFGISARPWIKFNSRNGHKWAVPGSSPVISLNYKKGFNNLLGSDVNYDLAELKVQYGFKVFAKGQIDFALLGGKFLNTRQLYFMDYKHFLGNQTPFITNDPIASFRLLDYYRHSSADQYFVGNVHYTFRKFLVTSIPEVRLAGIREVIFLNYLKTPTSRNYTELGYSIDGILRTFRLEAAAAFENGGFHDYGFRIGIAANVSVTFND